MPGNNPRLAALLQQLTLPDQPRRTLHIGCGAFSEYPLLIARWPDYQHIGVDWERDALRLASRQAVIQANGAHLPFGCHFSLILIRHPDVFKYPPVWTSILQTCGAHLAEDGLLVVTLYSLEEWAFVQEAMTLPCYQMDTLGLPAINLIGEDRYVVMGKQAGTRD